MKRIIMMVAVAALALSAVTAEGAKSPTIKSVNKTAKKALSVAEDANHTADANTVARDKKFAAQDDQIAEANRTAQTANGRVTSLPDTFNDNVVHIYTVNGTVAQDTKGIVAATCPGDQSVVGGGLRKLDTNQGVDVPQPQVTGWFIQENSYLIELNNINRTGNVDLTVDAYCIPK